MSILTILEGVDWTAEVKKGTTVASSLLPLLVKTALDGAKVGSGGSGALLTLLADIEADINDVTAAFTANNVEVAPPVVDPHSQEPTA